MLVDSAVSCGHAGGGRFARVPTPSRTALALRFPPGGPEDVKRIRKEAKWAHRKHQREGEQEEPWYRLSVWVDVQREGESRQDTMLRLVHAAGLNGINLTDIRNQLFWWSTAGDLYDRGFLLKKDGYADEPQEHWSVDLGSEPPSVVLVESFVGAFIGPERTGVSDEHDQHSDQPQPEG